MKVTAGKPYSFCVTVVTDGSRSGLLFERKKAGKAKPLYGYFWLKESEGHGPTPIIREKCGDNCHGLERAEYHQDKPKKFARLYIQERIFREILDYAKAAGETGNIKAERPLTQDYTDDTRGYAQILHRFFYADPPYELAEFLDGLDIFTGYVLRKPEGKACLVGMAEGFAVRSPHNIFPEEHFHCLRPIEEILKINNDKEPKWFRKTGPLAVDFDADKLYCRRELLDKLKCMVLSNSFSILEGVAATGKTVLARQVGYELFRHREKMVYYFDCDLERGFDFNELAEEINSVRGCVILENIHLETRKFQRVCDKIVYSQDKHLLLTARPSFRNNQYSKDFDLNSFPCSTLNSFENVDGIIEHYRVSNDLVDVSEEIIREIKETSQDSFWLLSYALSGCLKADRKVSSKEWIGKGIRDDLRDLENLDTSFPEALIAISPLYRNEVLTSERYLLEAHGFQQKTLNLLLARGEITKQVENDGSVFYGLPHSALAEMYWKYGALYKKRMQLPKYADYIYNYAISDNCNSLEAVIESEKEVRRAVLTKLRSKGELARVIETEESIYTIGDWLKGVQKISPPLKEKLAVVLTNKIKNHFNISFPHFVPLAYKRIGKKLFALLDLQEMTTRLCEEITLFRIGCFIEAMSRIDLDITKQLCHMLDLHRLATRFKEEGNFEISVCIEGLCGVDLEMAKNLCGILDHKTIVDASNRINLFAVGLFIRYVHMADIKTAEKICNELNLQKLANKIDNGQWGFYCGVGICLESISEANPDAAKKLCGMLKIEKLASRFNQEKKVSAIGRSIEGLYKADTEVCKELCNLLNWEEIARNLRKAEADEAKYFLKIMKRVDIHLAKNLK